MNTNSRHWITPDELGLFTDLYELTMLQAYHAAGMNRRASFSLHFRKLPANRRFMLACGQLHAAHLVTQLRFGKTALDRLASLGKFRDDFLRWLEDFRFTGDIVAMPEGTPVFPHEPMLEVSAPIAEAQLLEPLLMNMVHLETVLASKAARLVHAAQGRPVVDFGMRRMHGFDAAIQSVRAFRVAGIAGTSNVLGGLKYGLPVRGTMAHSFIQAHHDELDAFRLYADLYPGTTLLVDTFDTLAGVDKVIALKKERGKQFDIAAIRLDSGDLAELSRAARSTLDAAGMNDVKIIASGGLDEWKIAALLNAGAPIDAFGVGTALGTAADAPNLDLAYKLTLYDGEPRLKNSPGKPIYPGDKQVFRFRDKAGNYLHDEITLRHETRDATPLLSPIVTDGETQDAATLDTGKAAEHAKSELDALPSSLRNIKAGSDDGDDEYPVNTSDEVHALRKRALQELN